MPHVVQPRSVQRSYPRFYLVSLVTPLLVVLSYASITGLGYNLHDSGITQTILMLSALATCSIFIHQIRTSKIMNTRLARSLRLELIMLAIGSLLVPLAFLIGDVYGSTAFHDTEGIRTTPVSFAIIMLATAVIITTLFAAGNTVRLMSHTNIQAMRIINVISKIACVVLWLVIAASSYILYTLAYTAHDPTTE